MSKQFEQKNKIGEVTHHGSGSKAKSAKRLNSSLDDLLHTENG